MKKRLYFIKFIIYNHLGDINERTRKESRETEMDKNMLEMDAETGEKEDQSSL